MNTAPHRSYGVLVVMLLMLIGSTFHLRAQSAAAGEAEVQKCADRIDAVKRDILGKYDDALADLQTSLQKSADLEGALTVRSERARLAGDQTLSDANYVSEPKALRALQIQTATKLQELITQLVSEAVPKLIELKRQLTVAGKLDDAVAIRSAIEKLQDSYLPATRVDNGALVSADTLVTAFNADRARADKIYKGQKIIVHGVVGGFRSDPADSKSYQVFITGGAASGWVQCSFSAGDHHFREEKTSYTPLMLVVTNKDGDVTRVQKGMASDIRGTCEGWDESVRLSRCEFAR